MQSVKAGWEMPDFASGVIFYFKGSGNFQKYRDGVRCQYPVCTETPNTETGISAVSKSLREKKFPEVPLQVSGFRCQETNMEH